MEYFNAFLCGGLLCAIGQLLIDKTQLTPARILTLRAFAGQGSPPGGGHGRLAGGPHRGADGGSGRRRRRDVLRRSHGSCVQAQRETLRAPVGGTPAPAGNRALFEKQRTAGLDLAFCRAGRFGAGIPMDCRPAPPGGNAAPGRPFTIFQTRPRAALRGPHGTQTPREAGPLREFLLPCQSSCFQGRRQAAPPASGAMPQQNRPCPARSTAAFSVVGKSY